MKKIFVDSIEFTNENPSLRVGFLPRSNLGNDGRAEGWRSGEVSAARSKIYFASTAECRSDRTPRRMLFKSILLSLLFSFSAYADSTPPPPPPPPSSSLVQTAPNVALQPDANTQKRIDTLFNQAEYKKLKKYPKKPWWNEKP